MIFLSDGYLWHLCWMIPFLFLVLYIGISKRKKIAIALFHSVKLAENYTNLSKTKRYLRFSALILAVLFAVIAAARLAWGREILPDSGAGRDMRILFDVSKSMLSDDVKPTRIEQAKWLVQQLVKNNPGDRFGLIAFAGNAFLQCPLTIDKASFLQLTDALDTDTIPLGGTNLQLALETAVKAFEGAEGNHKAVILLTDGDELTGKAEAVTKQLAAAKIPLLIAGIGDPANPSVIQITNEKGEKKILTDKQGNAVKSPLNEVALAALAKETSGIYVRSTATDPGLKELQYAIRGLGRKQGSSQLATTRPIERPVLPLCLALCFLIFFMLLNDVKREKKKTLRRNISGTLLLALLFLPVCTLSGAEPNAEAPATATTTEEKNTGKTKKVYTFAEEYFNAGVQAQQEKDYVKAKENYEKAIVQGKNEKIRAFAYQNLGVMPHLDARAKMSAANEALKNQNPDAAEKELTTALQSLDQAENLYRESLRNSVIAKVDGAFNNQQLLLRDRKNAEELKKQIEELKKRQQQAQKQTQQAKNQQQKQNQQQSQQNQQNQQNQRQTQQAQQAVEQYRQQAEKLKQDQMKKSAEKAAEELQKARQEQQKNNGKKAEEHLQKALQALGADQQKKDRSKEQQQQNQQQKQDPKNDGKDQQKQSQQPQQQPQSANAKQEQAKDEKRDIDKNQAEAILNLMEKDEKDLRDLLKKMQKRNTPMQNPEKDW